MTSERYASPLAFKQAVEHRLRDRAAAEGVELARLRQLLVFDRFLARMAAAFGDRVVLKGGLVVELRVRRARTTKDIDLRILGDPEKALGKLQQAGRVDLGDYLVFEVRQDPRRPEIEAEGMRYPGRRYRVRGLLAAKLYGSPFGLDVAFAEPFSGAVEEVEGIPFLAFAGVAPAKVRIYPLEAHIAEKLHAFTMPRTRPNSRVKDLPDIALLASVRVIDATSLGAAIQRTFRARKTHDVPSMVPRAPETWSAVYDAMARADGLRWTTLERLAKDVSAFLDPVLSGATGRWDPITWTWSAKTSGA
ncbi:MAG: nucleotidyl transferase AbiEii/AbiGii toxin family protein [Planctomycetes bacterium]|nr:nucleotidyl transferase AbiEii/AbiGii toxin family protein [Planctomycetota bacterium]